MEKNKMQCDDKKSPCVGGMCAHGTCHSHYLLLRWVLGIIILIMVFSIGYTFGELKGEYGYGQYGGWGGRGNYGMMPNLGNKHYFFMQVPGTNTPSPAPAPASTSNSGTQK